MTTKISIQPPALQRPRKDRLPQLVGRNIVRGWAGHRPFIGTDNSGTLPLGKGVVGVGMNPCSHNVIGGAAPGEGNVIAATGFNGIGADATTDSIIQGDFIGTGLTGTFNLGNPF
jgi:glycine/D-amino acid oxidase-like deaminating enzyme